MKNKQQATEDAIRRVTDLNTVQRLTMYLENNGLNRNKLYDMAKLSVGALDPKKKDLYSKTIEKVANAIPELNVHWLVTGKGKMKIEEDRNKALQQESQELFDALRKINKLTDQVDLLKKQVKALDKENRIKDAKIYEQFKIIEKLQLESKNIA